MDNVLNTLDSQDGWQRHGDAARVHYLGAGDRYTIEFYAPNGRILYWKVPAEDDPREQAVPVSRETVPAPLRERVREDLELAGIDPTSERESL